MKKHYFVLLLFVIVSNSLFSFSKKSQPLAVTVSNIIPVTCNGACDGSALVTFTGAGTGPYTIQWIGGTNPTFTNVAASPFTCTGLCAGNYTVRVTGTLMTQVANIVISEPSPIAMFIDTQTNVTCNGLNNGAASVSVMGGTSPYTLQWNDPANQTGNTISNLLAGTYTCSIIDANGCVGGDFVTISEPTDIVTTIVSYQDVSCYNLFNGSATVEANGGASAYTIQLYDAISWQTYGGVNPNFQVNFPGLGVGPIGTSHTYTVMVTDLNGCEDSTTVTINQPLPLVIQNPIETDLSCYQSSDGQIEVTVTGGWPPYIYNWTSSNVGFVNPGVPIISGLEAGSYTLSLSDMQGCTDNQVANVIEPAPISAFLFTSPDTCGNSVGTANVNVSGFSSYNYAWSNSQNTQSLNNLQAGYYSVTIRDTTGCEITVSDVVGNYGAPVISSTVVNSTCNNDGSIDLSASGGTPPYQYSVNGSAFSSSTIYSNLPADTYSIVCVDANGCKGFANINVQSNGVFVWLTPINANCGLNNGIIASNPSGGIPPYTYLWLPGNETSANLTNAAPGTYTCIITDNVGCSYSTYREIENNGNVTLDYDYDFYNCGNNSITANANFGAGGYTYSWAPGAYNTATITNVAAGNYTCTVTDMNGCVGTGNFTIYNGSNNIVTGRVYDDLNSNCTFNGGAESTILPLQIYATNAANQQVGWASVNQQTGAYALYLPSSAGTYTLHLTNGYYYDYLTSNYNCSNNVITLAANCDTLQNVDLGYSLTIGQDLHVSNYCGVARPGFYRDNYIQYYNAGSTSVAATVKMQIDNLLMFSGSTPPPTSISGNLIEWNIGNLTPGQGGNIIVNTLVPTIQNGGALGTVLNDVVWIEPITGDTYASDNTSNCSSTIVGSYDPNYKDVFATNMDSFGGIDTTDTEMFYTIHFQNTGTAEAFTVVLKDTLSDLLDLSTFEALASSHHYTVNILPEKVLQVRYDNIMLPDSNTNEPLSHGYFHYKIRTNTDLQFGQQIENTAGIYFDFNPPIITNTVVTPIQENPVGIKNNKTELNALVYPNPASNSFKIQLNDASYKNLHFTMYNASGAKVMDKNLASQPVNEITTSGLTSGIYFYQLINADGKKYAGKIVIGN